MSFGAANDNVVSLHDCGVTAEYNARTNGFNPVSTSGHLATTSESDAGSDGFDTGVGAGVEATGAD